MHRALHVFDLGDKVDGAVFAGTQNIASLFVDNGKDTKPVGHRNQPLINLTFFEGDTNVPNIYLILL